MDQLKYSIAVKLIGHDADAVQGYSVARYLVANEQIGQWMCGILEGNDNNWLLGIVLRHPLISERRSKVCLVRCGKYNHLVVTFDNATMPPPGSLIPTISIDLFLAMVHGGNFSDDKIQEFGVLRDGSLFDHIRSGIDSGFNLGDLRVYVHPNVHCVNEVYTDSTEGGRLVRFCFKPGSWSVSRDVVCDKLEPYVRNKVASSGLLKADHKNNIATANSTKTSATTTFADPGDNTAVPIQAAIEDQSRRGKKRVKKISKSGKSDAAAISLSTISSADMTTGTKKSNIAASSCFYAPFCKKPAKDCGGIRQGLCNEVNSGKIKIPTQEVFQEEKRKWKNELKKERKAMTKNMLIKDDSANGQEIISDLLMNHKVERTDEHSVIFNPKEYLLLCKAWNDELTATDLKDNAEKYTEQDCKDAAEMLSNLAHDKGQPL